MKFEEIHLLQSVKKYPSLSITLPTPQNIQEKLQIPTVLKDLMHKAKEQMLKDTSPEEVGKLEKKLHLLANSVDYTKLKAGLAFFVNADTAHVYELPFTVPQRAIIDETFELRDLIRGFAMTPCYYALALDRHESRLFKGTGSHLAEITDKGFPFKLDYTVFNDSAHLAVATGDRDAAYRDAFTNSSIQELDKALKPFLSEGKKLVLLGTQKDRALFMQHATHSSKHVIAHHECDDKKSPIGHIAQDASKAIDKYLAEQAQKSLTEFTEAIGQLRHAFSIREVWVAAQEGRIMKLIVEKGYSVAGTVNPDNPKQIAIYENSKAPGIMEDMVNHVIDKVLETRGEVVFVEPAALQEYGHIAAILRYHTRT